MPSELEAPKATRPIIEVVRIVDGDTLELHHPLKGRSENARLIGYDTPETHRPKCAAERALGEEAKRVLAAILDNAKTKKIKGAGRDKYRRQLAEVFIDGRHLADLMVAAGVAVPYEGGRRIDWCARLG